MRPVPDRPSLLLQGVNRRFSDRDVLPTLDLTAHPGELVAVTGSNGAGKSTLLRIAAGLVAPTTGTAHVCGLDVHRQRRRARRCLGVSLNEDRSWYWRLTGPQNLELFARLSGRAVEPDALGQVGLAGVTTPVGLWSTGMRGRLGIARALLGDPPVLLLDEPTRALDAEGADLVRALVDERRVRGAAVVLTTHDPADLARATSVVRLP